MEKSVKMSDIVKAKDALVEANQAKEKSGSQKPVIEMKNYILDDLGALKKNWGMINHKPEIDVNGEASNG